MLMSEQHCNSRWLSPSSLLNRRRYYLTHDTKEGPYIMDQFIEYQKRITSQFVTRFVKNVQVSNTRRALQNLDDRTLSDLGIHRAQINSYVADIYKDAA